MAFLPGINATQSNFATNLAGLQIDQENKNRAVRLMFIQQFMERLIRERELKKQKASQQTASQQKSAINAGSIIAAPFTGGLSLGALQGSPSEILPLAMLGGGLSLGGLPSLGPRSGIPRTF